ncbi:NADPH-dependent FMN reductase [Andreprevotia chitinilytica]|uniref:NADPH-dependent FMN reductase n=1 Tax=Andreprevotia chitinilytica TaxID=396808 RepID=UPI000A0671B4|nr:NADPH-dependent FMN reductase [Andreprevotia chitinilytica]
MPYVITLSGSPADRSRSTHMLNTAEALLGERGIAVRRIDIRKLPAAALMVADTSNVQLREALEVVEHAQAVIIATPLYKSAYSGLLKIFLDALPQAALAQKPVLPLATGGSLAHLLALDYALKPVLASLGAQHVLSNVFATEQDVVWRDDRYVLAEPIAARLAEAIDAFVQVLEDAAELRRFRSNALVGPRPFRRTHARQSEQLVGQGSVGVFIQPETTY